MKKIKVKQGTLKWEEIRSSRIGSSEVFDIVRYYAKDDELQNCGINAEDFRRETPYTTAWALYHKLLNDGLYKKGILAPEFAEYGHAAEPYGVYVLSKGRTKKLKAGEVYIDGPLIVSLDISGIAEDVDTVAFDYGSGTPKIGQRFVCEQKTMQPQMLKNGLPFKYIIQAQYQILETKADFFILQLMILNDDTVFNRGKVCQMSPKKRRAYLDENMTVKHLYFQNNEYLARLIEVCLDRFFDDVKNFREPTPFIEYDTQQNIIESIRQNALFNDNLVCDYDLHEYIFAKNEEDNAKKRKTEAMQKIIETAKANNACRFRSEDGTTGRFAKGGRFLVRIPEEVVS